MRLRGGLVSTSRFAETPVVVPCRVVVVLVVVVVVVIAAAVAAVVVSPQRPYPVLNTTIHAYLAGTTTLLENIDGHARALKQRHLPQSVSPTPHTRSLLPDSLRTMLPGNEQLVLEGAARDGSLDRSDWPRCLEAILLRLDEIVHEFPKPAAAPPDPSTQRSPASTQEFSFSQDKENAPPPASPARAAAAAVLPSSTPPRPSSHALSSSQTIPAEHAALHGAIRASLRRNFPASPPHTIQRLAELILAPKRHYRFLAPYLRALDRVVSVSSNTSIFPLPLAVLPHSSGLLNGVAASAATNAAAAAALGSDESLGGALLTPIPWLRPERAGHPGSELVSESTEMVDGPNGAGRIETVSVVNGRMVDAHSLREAGGLTQGELLRQEQEAGVVPMGQASPRRAVHATDGAGRGEEAAIDPEEVPHARGPEEIGMEDTGPLERPLGSSLDLEAAVGRPSAASVALDRPSQPAAQQNEADMADPDAAGEPDADADADADADPDLMAADPDEPLSEDRGGRDPGDGHLPDAIDVSARP